MLIKLNLNRKSAKSKKKCKRRTQTKRKRDHNITESTNKKQKSSKFTNKSMIKNHTKDTIGPSAGLRNGIKK